jgi:hypothetical protein
MRKGGLEFWRRMLLPEIESEIKSCPFVRPWLHAFAPSWCQNWCQSQSAQEIAFGSQIRDEPDRQNPLQVLSIMNQKLRASDRSVVSVCAEVADAEHDPRNGSRRCGYCLRF